MKQAIYLDYNATTPVAEEVAAAMRPWIEEEFGNPSSSHDRGLAARRAVAESRIDVAELVGAADSEIVFAASATEANNLALLGMARAAPSDKRHLVISSIEHPAVMQPALHLRELGWTLDIVPVDGHGCVDPEAIRAALRPETALVSVMHANNEVGTVQRIADMAEMAHANGSLMHTDAAQTAGKIEVDVERLGVDLLTLAGHKFHAPKGVGALFVRRGTPLLPILFGADQERGLRPGTENVAQVVGLGAAARLARLRFHHTASRIEALRDRLHALLSAAVPGLELNGHPRHRLPNTLHVSFPGVFGRDLLAATPGIAASVGSACHSAHDAVSGVLAAMGLDAARARGAVRLSLGVPTSGEEVAVAAAALGAAWRRLVP